MPINRIKYRNKIHNRRRKGTEDLTTPFLYCLVVTVFSAAILLLMNH